MYNSLSLSGRLTMDLHALNNEGSEGNTMQTRMVDVLTFGRDGSREPKKHTVNAVSGDMFKHILVEHLIDESKSASLPLCAGCKTFSANRIADDDDFKKTKGWNKETKDSEILGSALQRCVIDDCAGILITSEIGKSRSIARKSCVEFGWVVGIPELVTTESYFHAKYVPEGRGKGSGEGENLGQNIFHRPASSGQYAVVVSVDLYKVGRNDITLEYPVDLSGRLKRTAALLRSLMNTFLKPTGAHRNTQNPHVVNFEGLVTLSRGSLPAPLVSPLNHGYIEELEKIATALNGLDQNAPAIELKRFHTMGEFAETMAKLTQQLGEA